MEHYLASTKPFPKPWVDPSIRRRGVKATPSQLVRLHGSRVQPLLVQVPLVTFFSTFRASVALELITACIALYCMLFCSRHD